MQNFFLNIWSINKALFMTVIWHMLGSLQNKYGNNNPLIPLFDNTNTLNVNYFLRFMSILKHKTVVVRKLMIQLIHLRGRKEIENANFCLLFFKFSQSTL